MLAITKLTSKCNFLVINIQWIKRISYITNQPTSQTTIQKTGIMFSRLRCFFPPQLTIGVKKKNLTRRTSCKENPHFHDVGSRLSMDLALSGMLFHLSTAVSVFVFFHLLLHQRIVPTSISKHLCQWLQIINCWFKLMDPGLYSDFNLDWIKGIWNLCMCSF